MKPIIVGIDPGTTSAYAILDSEGNLLELKSSRKLDLGSMITEIIKHGNPVLVGCDKNPAPGFVEKFATKAGARLTAPEQDLKVEEKKEMTRVETNNSHEMDAYASAVFAFKNHEKTFRKVEDVLEKEGKEYLSDQIKYLVVKEGMNIKKAIQYLEEVEEEPEEPEDTKIRVVRPERELKELEKEIALLEQKNSSLSEELKEARRENSRLKKRIKGMPVDRVVKEKEKTIRELGKKLEEKEREAKDYEEKLGDLKGFVAKGSDRVFMKKLKNLSRKEFKEKDWMRFLEGDVLLVDDANVASRDVLEELRGVVEVIAHKKDLSVRHEGFTFVRANQLDLEETRDFAYAMKESFKDALAKKDVLKKVVLEYKKKRKV